MEIGKPGGLIAYVCRGTKLPSIEHVKAYQKALKHICDNCPKRTNSKYYYKHIDLSSNKILNIKDLNTSHLNIAVFESLDIKFT